MKKYKEIKILYCPLCRKKMTTDLHDYIDIDNWVCYNKKCYVDKLILDRDDIKQWFKQDIIKEK